MSLLPVSMNLIGITPVSKKKDSYAQLFGTPKSLVKKHLSHFSFVSFLEAALVMIIPLLSLAPDIFVNRNWKQNFQIDKTEIEFKFSFEKTQGNL